MAMANFSAWVGTIAIGCCLLASSLLLLATAGSWYIDYCCRSVGKTSASNFNCHALPILSKL